MPGAIKKRKLGVAPQKSHPQRGISSFTTVSKASASIQVVLEKNHYVDSHVLAPTKEQPPNAKKRKLVEDDKQVVPGVSEKRIKALPQRTVLAKATTPRTPKKDSSANSTTAPAETPTKQARNLFDKLLISKNTSAHSPKSTSSHLSSSFDASTPKSLVAEKEPPQVQAVLPSELLDLINLHASFLTALSIHYAHNGTHTPADLRSLCPDVARSWGKRKVHLEDVRRTIGLLNHNGVMYEGKLSLSNYGHGKICVEIQTSESGKITRPINEDLSNKQFTAELRKLWSSREDHQSPHNFISALPLEPIRENPSLIKINPLLAKGQRRLEDMMSGLATKHEEKIQKIEDKKTAPVKTTLLERLRAKQLAQSTLAPGLTPAQLSRRAALGRTEEVVAVLSILSTSGNIGQSRVSFTLGTVMAKLKDSFRTPISKDEAEACLRVLAEEVAPEWVKIVKMGKVEAMVVSREKRLAEGEIKARVERLRETQ